MPSSFKADVFKYGVEMAARDVEKPLMALTFLTSDFPGCDLFLHSCG